MRRKILLLLPIAFLALPLALPARAVTSWFVEAQAEVTGFTFVGLDPEGRGLLFDVPFVGVAGGPSLNDGTVEGVDHVLIDWEGIGHLNLYGTITDAEGDKISGHATGLSVPETPGLKILKDVQGTIIDIPGYPTTGKYVGLIGATYREVGFVSELSREPPGGYIHVKYYWA